MVIPSILAVPRAYFLPAGVLGLMFMMDGLGRFFIVNMEESMIVKIFRNLIFVYLCLVEAKLLGYLYRCNREKLGWLE